jgi:V8-like Glu-specific endopeptidase
MNGQDGVSGIFDKYPLDFSRAELREMCDLLGRTIFRLNEIENIVLDAGLNPGRVDFSGTATLQWRSVFMRARAQERITDLLAAIGAVQPPLTSRIGELLAPTPVLEPGLGDPDDPTRADEPKWEGFGGERLIVPQTDTLLGVSFLAVGVLRSRSICRITSVFEGQLAYGTAALIGPGLLLTNHHVLHDWNNDGRAAKSVQAHFNYELDAAGLSRQPTVVTCNAATIVGDRTEDWAVVRTAEPPPDGSAILDLAGAAPPRRNDYVFIIQHPEGGPKMIGLSHNLVRYVDDNVIQYWTDTKTGSSGAPIFDTSWRVVGLHHRWIPAPKSDGVAFRNQGRRIERVIQGLRSFGILE